MGRQHTLPSRPALRTPYQGFSIFFPLQLSLNIIVSKKKKKITKFVFVHVKPMKYSYIYVKFNTNKAKRYCLTTYVETYQWKQCLDKKLHSPRGKLVTSE